MLFVLLWVFYSMLTAFDPEEMIIGAVLSLIISSITHFSFTHGKRTGYWKAILGAVAFIPYFVYTEFKSNLSVIRMIITGRIDPGFVRIPNNHNNDFGTTFLANMITMTPGTLTIDADDKHLLVHCIDKKMKKKDIYKGLDHFIGHIWD